MIWRCGKYSFDSRMPVIMGILNVTPDSFSDGGRFYRDSSGEGLGEGDGTPVTVSPINIEAALAHAHQMVNEGALIIDVGGESTRPGAAEVSIEEELARTVEVVRALAAEDICVSIDTRHVQVAQACVQAGASIINDVSGFRDSAMVEAAASCDAGLIVMHWDNRSASSTTGNAVLHEAVTDETAFQGDIVAEVCTYLTDQAHMLEAAGVARERIALDPGPGFGKTNKQSLELMRNLQEVVHLGYPVVAAPSRKRYVGEAYGIESAQGRDEASATEALMACELGASVVRMHNVATTAAMLEHLRPYCVLALGANVALVGTDDEVQETLVAQLNQAISDLCLLPDSQLIDVSSFYVSEPAYVEDQAKFVNAVVLMRTSLSPRDMLRYIHAIEDSLGRVREVRNGPRTCDIDILDYQLYVSNDEELTLPHPRILERDFVVKPLLEILPNHVLSDGTLVTADNVTLGWATKV